MNRLLTGTLLASVAAISLTAETQRITTHPADPYLKQLFPTAAAISAHQGQPLHWKIYAEKTPRATPIGLAWWSTDVVPLERGYNGPTHMFVGMNMAGTIIGTVMAYSTDPYAFFSVEPPEFAAQFKGKSIRAPFRVGEDIHAVSRATLTVSSATRAVRDSARAMARLFLNPADVQ
jgi:transcriptional regulator of nitric oxide reductase